ncbi:spore germination protein KC [Ruminiclostridium sufflavum DSM 19573]|uniref:Spore germination protein KC n=1 Tax=Ruminiclostridium sufflavum DSM 19573 TaxID=1121337 RepID=A0A318XR96_9FIRM|nr:Ger(x)C family spore germination protein [Ruminiclostridium sufflavum]PYG88532.1 spore germination protein KC [Ruminiclostridium sufflavum DSM 19573]
MSIKLRLTSLFMSIALSAALLSGCYDINEIEDLAYVIAIGIDKADEKNFTLTFQTAVPKSIAGGEGESIDIRTFRTDNFLSGLKKASEYLDRRINLSHTKIIVVSEEIAKEGIMAFLNGLQQNIELRPNVNIIVASEGAQKYIESIQPKLSSSPAKHYALLFKSYETDFLVKDTQLEDYLYRAKNHVTQPVAIYTSIDKSIGDTSEASEKEDKKSEEDSKKAGGEEKDKSKEKEEAMAIKGLAVFQMDKMVGTLNRDEAMLFSLLTSTENRNMEIIDPLDNRFKVLGNITKSRSSSTKAIVKDGKPQIDITLKLNVDVKAVQSDNDYDEPEKAAKLEAAYEQYLHKGIMALLNKTTKELKSDIFGFSQQAKRSFKTIGEWEKANWQEIFPKSEYNLKIKVDIRRQS